MAAIVAAHAIFGSLGAAKVGVVAFAKVALALCLGGWDAASLVAVVVLLSLDFLDPIVTPNATWPTYLYFGVQGLSCQSLSGLHQPFKEGYSHSQYPLYARKLHSLCYKRSSAVAVLPGAARLPLLFRIVLDHLPESSHIAQCPKHPSIASLNKRKFSENLSEGELRNSVWKKPRNKVKEYGTKL